MQILSDTCRSIQLSNDLKLASNNFGGKSVNEEWETWVGCLQKVGCVFIDVRYGFHASCFNGALASWYIVYISLPCMVHACYMFHGFMHVPSVLEIRDHGLVLMFETTNMFSKCGSNMICLFFFYFRA